MTAQKRAAAESEAAREYAESIVRTVRTPLIVLDEAQQNDEWIAMLGHELRNPIGAVSNGLVLLEQGLDAGRQAKVQAMMRRQLDQGIRRSIRRPRPAIRTRGRRSAGACSSWTT